MIKLTDIENQLTLIRQAARDEDYEQAHSLEDRLHVQCLQAIASAKVSVVEAAQIAQVALRSQEIEFQRRR